MEAAASHRPSQIQLPAALARQFLIAMVTLAAIAVTGSGLYLRNAASTRIVRSGRDVGRLGRDARAAALTAANASRQPAATGAAAAVVPEAVLARTLDSLVRLTADAPALHARVADVQLSARAWAAAANAGESATTAARRLDASLVAFVDAAERRYRAQLLTQSRWQRAAVLLLLAELLVTALIFHRLRVGLLEQSRTLLTQHDRLAAQNDELSAQTIQLNEQHAQLEQQAAELELQTTELQEHAAELELANVELAAASGLAIRAQGDAEEALRVLRAAEAARSRAELELLDQGRLLHAVVEGSPVAIVTLDPALRISGWNAAASRLLGGDATERIGTAYAALVPLEERERHEALHRAILDGETPTGLETQRLHRNGGLVDVSLSLGALRDASGELIAIVVILADIGRRKELERQLRHSQKLEAVGQLAGGVAHDFNNLLTVISSYTQMLLRDQTLQDSPREYLREIGDAAQRAALLTRQLLAFSRQQILRPRPLSLNEVLEGMRSLLGRLVREDISVKMDLDAGAGLVLADQGQVEQVIVNLVVNAREAMPDGGTMTIETSGLVVAEDATGPQDGLDLPPGSYVRLAVSDTGKGMDQETVERIFEPFFTTKEQGRGAGLGLSTVFGIVRQTGGHVVVRSAPGEGALFVLYLPSCGEAPDQSESAWLVSPPAVASETVLLVEDDDALRAVAALVLRRQGYVVEEARNGREALAAVARPGASFDLVVADMVMPEMNGRELVDELTRRVPALRTLMMSGYTRDVVVREGLEGAGGRFLEKPFTPDRLAAAVREALDTRALRG